MYAKIWVLVLGCLLTALEAFYLAGVEWMNPASRFGPPPDYMARSWYYVMIFLIEFIVVMLYAFARVDQRFHTGRIDAHNGTRASTGYGGPGGPLPMSGAAAGAPPKRKRFGGTLGKLALGAGAGAAAAGLAHHVRPGHKDKEVDMERDGSPSPR